MAQGLIQQVKELLNQQDEQSLKYVISDEDPSVIQEICSLLPQKEAATVKKLYKESRPEEDLNEIFGEVQEDKNQKIDQYLLEKREGEKKQESFLEMMAKLNQKLVFEEHFGFPFYDLLKRILKTHGDAHPLVQTVKALHSQVQILYSTLFSPQMLSTIEQKFPNFDQGLKYLFEQTFAKELEIYHNFQKVYKNIKKSTEQEQSCSQDQEDQVQQKEIPVNQDETLELDQKQFLVKVAEEIPVEQFNQFTKNRSYNFLCFGVKKYLLFLSIDMEIASTLKQKQFADILSFLSIRFIRKIIFGIIRERGNGQLLSLKTAISPQEIKVVGNALLDKISEKIEKLIVPLKNVEEEAKALFLEEFDTMTYSDFLPRKFKTEAIQKQMDPAQYVWSELKQYRTLWSQRVKAERYVRQNKKGVRPMLQYLNCIQDNVKEFQACSKKLWKNYIMKKFGFETQVKRNPSKRIKLKSLND